MSLNYDTIVSLLWLVSRFLHLLLLFWQCSNKNINFWCNISRYIENIIICNRNCDITKNSIFFRRYDMIGYIDIKNNTSIFSIYRIVTSVNEMIQVRMLSIGRMPNMSCLKSRVSTCAKKCKLGQFSSCQKESYVCSLN